MGDAVDGDPVLGAVTGLDAPIHYVHAKAAPLLCRLVEPGVVAHLQHHPLRLNPGGQGQQAGFEHLGDAVLDRVLDDGLQGEGGQPVLQQRFGNMDLHAQVLGEAGLFDVQIGVHMLQLVGQGHLVPLALEVLAKEGGEIVHQGAGALGIAPDHRRQGVEGVEQEVRIDLRLQQLDLRLGQQPLLLVVFARQDLA